MKQELIDEAVETFLESHKELLKLIRFLNTPVIYVPKENK